MFDRLVDICGHALDTGHTGASGGVRPHLLVTTPLSVITGAGADHPASTEVAEVAWTGHLTNEATRRLACDAEITRVVVDPPSQPLDVGRTTRTVPAHLRNALIVRDRGCVAEGCDRPPAWTEAPMATTARIRCGSDASGARSRPLFLPPAINTTESNARNAVPTACGVVAFESLKYWT